MEKMDFCGFKFNGHHSSEYGLIRTSNSSRYVDNLVPTFKDQTVQVPGGDGTYFFRSNYTQNTFDISVAFDNISEETFRNLRAWLNGKETGTLIFDEAPYKAYLVKVQSAPQFKHLCFDKEAIVDNSSKTERVYKGEGSIKFVAYYPYARSVHKFLDDYLESSGQASEEIYTNKSEWAAASRLKKAQEDLDKVTERNNEYVIPLFNGGDIEADFKFYGLIGSGQIKIQLFKNMDNKPIAELGFNAIDHHDQGEYICIDSRLNLIQGCIKSNNEYVLNDHLFNKYIKNGDFFKIPVSDNDNYYLKLIGVGTEIVDQTTKVGADIEYDYLYY